MVVKVVLKLVLVGVICVVCVNGVIGVVNVAGAVGPVGVVCSLLPLQSFGLGIFNVTFLILMLALHD